MSSTTVLINTDVNGDFSYERPFFGLIAAAMLDVGTLDTGAFDVILTDTVADVTLHEFGELDGDGFWQPSGPVAVYGSLRIVVAAGGDTKHGSVRLMTQT